MADEYDAEQVRLTQNNKALSNTNIHQQAAGTFICRRQIHILFPDFTVASNLTHTHIGCKFTFDKRSALKQRANRKKRTTRRTSRTQRRKGQKG